MRQGRFEIADGGTIFLDEIGDLQPQTQVKLLRVLQEREFERVGGTKTVKVNVRIIAATHRDLQSMVEQRLFREDLYYRLSVFPIYIPSLAKRKTDIILLADYFMAKYSEQNGKKVTKFSNDAIDLLMRHSWPGNVRELENCIERAVLLTEGEVIRTASMPSSIQLPGEPDEPPKVATPMLTEGMSLEELVGGYEQAILNEALKLNRSNIAATARQLRSTPRIIGYKAKQYGLAGN
jgi:Nif-specific regulatory protein